MIAIGIIGLILLLSLVANIVLFLKPKSDNLVYVDRGGISSNPPTFLDTWQNKTINFSYKGLEIKISHLPIRENLEVISRLAGLFAILRDGASAHFKVPFTKDLAKSTYQQAYIEIVNILFTLSKPHIKKTFRYKKKFFNHFIEDSEAVFQISSQIFDYWQYMGKLLAVLAQGLTPRLVYGADLTSGSLKWDTQGNRLIEPRYEHLYQFSKSGQPIAKKKESI